MYLNFFLLLALGLLTVHADENDTHLCVDCRQSLKNCHILETGYSIRKRSQTVSMPDEQLLDGTIAESLDTCIPNGLQIKEKNFEIACVWSPELGCQMLLHRSESNPSCLPCLFDKNIYKVCPCQNTPERIDKEFVEKSTSRSERIYGGTLPILISFYFVQQSL